MVDRRTLGVDVATSGPGANQRIEIASFELVRVTGQGFKIGHAVETAARSKNVAECECAQCGETASASTADYESIAIGVTAIDEKARCGDGIIDIDNSPLTDEAATIGTAVSSGAAVVDVDNAEST